MKKVSYFNLASNIMLNSQSVHEGNYNKAEDLIFDELEKNKSRTGLFFVLRGRLSTFKFLHKHFRRKVVNRPFSKRLKIGYNYYDYIKKGIKKNK